MLLVKIIGNTASFCTPTSLCGCHPDVICFNLIFPATQARNVNFDIGNFLAGVVLADLKSPVHPFLLGRCLWVASKFPAHLPQATITTFLEATVRGLQQDQPHPVRFA
jgi:hypothetical protein